MGALSEPNFNKAKRVLEQKREIEYKARGDLPKGDP